MTGNPGISRGWKPRRIPPYAIGPTSQEKLQVEVRLAIGRQVDHTADVVTRMRARKARESHRRPFCSAPA